MSTVYTITDLVGDGATFTGDPVDAREWLAREYGGTPVAADADRLADLLDSSVTDADEYRGLCTYLGLRIEVA